MSYTPTTWANGDTITAAKLNKMERGIAAAGSGYDLVIASSVGVQQGIQNVANWHVASGSFEACVEKLEAGVPINAVVIVWEQQWSTDPPNDLRFYLPLVHYYGPYGIMRFGAILNDSTVMQSVTYRPAYVYVTVKFDTTTYEITNVHYQMSLLSTM